MTMKQWPSGGIRPARVVMAMVLAASAAQYCPAAEKVTGTFNAYVDSNLCAHLMLGPLTDARMECSKTTHKQGSNAVLVRLNDSTIFDVNKTKMIDPLIGQIVSSTGEIKVKDGSIKLTEVNPVAAATIKPGTPDYRLLDLKHNGATSNPKVYESIRHELAMLPYVSEYDFISFTLVDGKVILTGWTIRDTNRSSAYNVVKNVGNYGEVFEKNIGQGSPLKIARGLNALWNKGGIQYAPPVR